MRKITEIVIHCSASRPAQAITQTAKDIDQMHRQRGFRKIGYHYFIRHDGMVERGRPEEEIGAHVEGHNATTIGVCYAGGLDDHGKPADTRTPAQEAAMLRLVVGLKAKYPGARIVGHRDLSPDTNHNGRVDKWEWLKDCPCFEVADWAAARGLK